MNYYYNLYDRQAAYLDHLLDGGNMVIVVPLPVQPTQVYEIIEYDPGYNGGVYYLCNPEIGLHGYNNKLPYPLNARVGLREIWANHPYGYLYKIDGHKDAGGIMDSNGVTRFKWCSAQSMPREAIRHWGTVTGARVDRVQNITEYEWNLAGFKFMFPPMECGSNTLKTPEAIYININKVKDCFNSRYKGKWSWEQNIFVEIAIMKKE